MNQLDNIHILTDSIGKITSDSLATVDSINRMDSIHVADSLKLVLQKPTGFIGIPHPSLPQNESWVFIALFILFIFLVFSMTRSSGLIADSIKTFFQVKERTSIFSKASVTDSRFRVFLITFSVLVISFYIYTLLFESHGVFSFIKYLQFLVVTILFFGFKALTFLIIGYVFLDNTSAKLAKESYFRVVAFLGIVLFPLLIFQVYVPVGLMKIDSWISFFVCISAYILITIKLFQIFFHNIVAFFYILLYLCTLEILPLFALYRAYQLLM